MTLAVKVALNPNTTNQPINQGSRLRCKHVILRNEIALGRNVEMAIASMGRNKKSALCEKQI